MDRRISAVVALVLFAFSLTCFILAAIFKKAAPEFKAVTIPRARVSCEDIDAYPRTVHLCFVYDLATERRFIIATHGQGVAIASDDPIATADHDDDFPPDSPSQLAAEPTRTDSRIFERR